MNDTERERMRVVQYLQSMIEKERTLAQGDDVTSPVYEIRARMVEEILYVIGRGFHHSHEPPGTFVYSGMGWGHYHSKDGGVYWCVRSEAAEHAARERVQFIVRGDV